MSTSRASTPSSTGRSSSASESRGSGRVVRRALRSSAEPRHARSPAAAGALGHDAGRRRRAPRRPAGPEPARPLPRAVVAAPAPGPARGGRDARGPPARSHRRDARHDPPGHRPRRARAASAHPTRHGRRARPAQPVRSGPGRRRPRAGHGVRPPAARRHAHGRNPAASEPGRALPRPRRRGTRVRVPVPPAPGAGAAAGRVGQAAAGHLDPPRHLGRCAARGRAIARRRGLPVPRRVRPGDDRGPRRPGRASRGYGR